MFVSQNPREFCVSYSPRQILICTCTICYDGRISISCTIPSGSPSQPSYVWSCTFFVQIKRHSVSLLRFLFCSPVQVFSCEISSICRLKYPNSCFSSHFFFKFLMYSSSLRIGASTLSSMLPSFFFLDTHTHIHTNTYTHTHTHRRCPRGVMVKAMVCEIVAREFEIQLRYYVHFQTNTFGKGMNPLSSQLWVK